MRHESLPNTLTTESLAQWITDNAKDEINHVDKVDLDPEKVREYEHKLANSTAAKLRLEELKKEFNECLKKGTGVSGFSEESGEPIHDPQNFIVPPTKGLDALNANIRFYSDLLERGFEENHTMIYIIPYPEKKRMVGVDIEGNEWEQYSKDMTPAEVSSFGNLFQEENESQNETKKPKRESKKKEVDSGAFGVEEEVSELDL